jgi:hypothetical protein
MQSWSNSGSALPKKPEFHMYPEFGSELQKNQIHGGMDGDIAIPLNKKRKNNENTGRIQRAETLDFQDICRPGIFRRICPAAPGLYFVDVLQGAALRCARGRFLTGDYEIDK